MTIDFAKRRRVMSLSQQLGHCICDPLRPCPCEILRDRGFCPCAGERPEVAALADVRLTQTVHSAGCASKIPPGELDAILRRLPPVNDPAVVSGIADGDDAGIYRIAPNLHLVQTVDVFTPCVDEPRLFGRICAANCLSDIYAMGGEPRTALSIVAFPLEKLPGDVVAEALAGAMEVFAGAGVALIGGHSIKDEEMKLGFAITGVIEPLVAASLTKPRAGDLLVLTKPLGTGVIAFASQIGRAEPDMAKAAAQSMATLNRAASEAMREAGASACTDVTGFGLFGHLSRMLRTSGLGAEVWANALPALPGTLDALRAGIVPGAIERNREYIEDKLRIAQGVAPENVNLGLDAQTSGGLLISISEERMPKLEQALERRGVRGTRIGRINGDSKARIDLVVVEKSAARIPSKKAPDSASHADCCADVFQHTEGAVADVGKNFGAFMRATQAGGAIDEKHKELILFSLVLLSRCEPCFETHLHRARELGITQAELDEAAWCAVAMGGAPVRQFYQACLTRAK